MLNKKKNKGVIEPILIWLPATLCSVAVGVLLFVLFNSVPKTNNTMDISNLEFNMLNDVLADIPEIEDGPGFIVRYGFSMTDNSYKIAFNDYRNNNIYAFDGYKVVRDVPTYTIDDNYGLFIINHEKSTLDNISTNTYIPTLKKTININNLSSIAGVDRENSLIFLATTDNNLFCYNMSNNEMKDCVVESFSFEDIYNKVSLAGDVMDFLFLSDYKLLNGESAKGVYMTYHDGKKINHIFFKYDPLVHSFKKIDT